jgi:hypothetical protein
MNPDQLPSIAAFSSSLPSREAAMARLSESINKELRAVFEREQVLASIVIWITLTGVAACSSEPNWLLLDELPASSTYVDTRSIARDGVNVRATLRSVYATETTAPAVQKPHRSTVMTVVIDCDAKKWATIKFTSLNAEGRTVEERQSSRQDFYPFPN